MSSGNNTTTQKKRKRKTRLKGTDTKKPCAGPCGRMLDRFKDFKPRWAGCEKHKTEKGRRYFSDGCDDCAAKVNGHIRQPRCVECDRGRKKKKKKAATPTPTVETPTVVLPSEPETEPNPEPVIEAPVIPVEAPVEVEAQDEPSPESVSVPAASEQKRPVNAAELFSLLSGDSDGE